VTDGRILGIDPGERRIGIALSDPAGIIASPHAVIDTRQRSFAADLREICTEFDVVLIVVGRPTSLSGHEGPAVERAKRVAETAHSATGLPIVYVDERFTTKQAERALLEGNVRRAERKKMIDKVAASFILQTYLDKPTRSTQ
jgi:putative pre-16S rRNA nuclease